MNRLGVHEARSQGQELSAGQASADWLQLGELKRDLPLVEELPLLWTQLVPRPWQGDQKPCAGEIDLIYSHE